ncbi:hypothetical protein [Streptomyces halstedii]
MTTTTAQKVIAYRRELIGGGLIRIPPGTRTGGPVSRGGGAAAGRRA